MKTIKNAKPCPFCGNTKITYVRGEDGWFIGCRFTGNHEACNALIGDSNNKGSLLTKWNSRKRAKMEEPGKVV